MNTYNADDLEKQFYTCIYNMSDNNKRLKILFLTPRFPYPLIGGDRLKPYHILKHLAGRHDVTHVTFHQGGPTPDDKIQAMQELGLRLISIPLKSISGAAKGLLHNPFKPLEISYYTQSSFRKTVDRLLDPASGENFDLAFAFFMRTAEYLKDKTNLKKILMAEDCRRIYQQRSYKESKRIHQRLVRWWEYFRLKSYEPKICNHFDITTLVTEQDVAAMNEKNSDCRYEVLSNGTDTEHFKPSIPVTERQGIMFSGKFDVWANELMVKRIVRDIMPRVWEAMPDVRLNLVGANPTSRIKSMLNERIRLHPNVPEMLPYLQQTAVFLHPHLGGSGIQNKVLEAMSSGAPVVTSPTGTQGIPSVSGKHLLIGKDNDELARHTIDLLTNLKLAEKISAGGRQLIIDTHSWETIYESVDRIINSLFEEGSEKK